MMNLYRIDFMMESGSEDTDYVIASDVMEAITATKKFNNGLNVKVVSIKQLAEQDAGNFPTLVLDKGYFTEITDVLKNTIELLESIPSEANLGDHELDCDGESCVLCDNRKLYDKLINSNDID